MDMPWPFSLFECSFRVRTTRRHTHGEGEVKKEKRKLHRFSKHFVCMCLLIVNEPIHFVLFFGCLFIVLFLAVLQFRTASNNIGKVYKLTDESICKVGLYRFAREFFAEVCRFGNKMVKSDSPNYVDRDGDTPMKEAIATFFGYFILELFGHLNEFLRKMGFLQVHSTCEQGRENYVPLYHDFADFYKKYVYRRVRDCWNRPISSAAGAEFTILDRISFNHGWDFQLKGTTTRAINMGSYNYLGFADNGGPCTDATEARTRTYSCATCGPRLELGTLDVHNELESLVARFVGVEDSIVFGMGFATNSLNIPTLLGKGCLILSDELNHASIVLGSRLSRATISIFKHNNMQDLERKLRDAIIKGQPKTHRPWKKILIMVEGVYSMEGTIVNLPEVIRLKKKYKAYVYLDEAHSIGAIGPRGRGVVDYHNIDPADVDILMGTFTKSFGAVGGYIAGTKKLIDHIRCTSLATHYGASMSASVAQQVLSSIKIIMGEDGTNEGSLRVKQLAINTRYFRRRLDDLGFILYGGRDSPIVPVLMYMPSKITLFSRMALENDIAVVPVGFPATPLNKCRVRFCISAAHTKEMLDKTLDVCGKVGDVVGCKYKDRRRSKKHVNATSADTEYASVWAGPSKTLEKKNGHLISPTSNGSVHYANGHCNGSATMTLSNGIISHGLNVLPLKNIGFGGT